MKVWGVWAAAVASAVRTVEASEADVGYIAQVSVGAACEEIKQGVERHKEERWREKGETLAVEVGHRCFVTFTGNDEIAQYVQEMPGVEDVVRDETVVEDKVSLEAREPDTTSYERRSMAIPSSEDGSAWALDRIDQRTLPMNKEHFSPAYSGKGQTVYVVDSGIYVEHTEFAVYDEYGGALLRRRATLGADFVDEVTGSGDANGHGTGVAAAIGGVSLGVARDVNLVSVKVMGVNGLGSSKSVLQALAWIQQREGHNLKRGISTVVSLAFQISSNRLVDVAANAASDAGLLIVVAAGNNARDACEVSPAGSGGEASLRGGPLSVATSTQVDRLAEYSNRGPCVDLIAPGDAVLTAYNTEPFARRIMSGSSLSSAYVAGAAAALLEKHDGSKTKAIKEVFSLAARNVIKGTDSMTPNLLLQVESAVVAPGVKPTPYPTLPPEPNICVGSACFRFMPALYGPRYAVESVMQAPLEIARTDLCSMPQQNFRGKIVLVSRGNCKFFDKTLYAQRKGAVAVIVYLVTYEEPLFTPSYLEDSSMIKIKTFVVDRAAADSLLGAGRGSQVSVGFRTDPTPPYPTSRPTPAPTARPTKSCSSFGTVRACKAQAHCMVSVDDSRSCVSMTARPTASPTTPEPTAAPTLAPTTAVPTLAPTVPTMAPSLQVLGGCKRMDYASAVNACQGLGMRLCTPEEMDLSPPDNRCGFDRQYVWSRATCNAVTRSSLGIRRSPKRLQKCYGTKAKLAVRCCPEEVRSP